MIETIDKLIEFARFNRYSDAEILLIQNAYVIASRFCVNKYRYRKPKRPFINHLISTSAILIKLGVNIETVVAGLLHSVKTEMPAIYQLNQTVGDIVANYFDSHVGKIEKIEFANLSLIQSAVITIQTANLTDMLLAGEVKP